MKKNLVSIGIPAYKGRFLGEAISSLLNQTYSDIEIIIVNDKSPEDLGTIVSEFIDERIRYVENKENIGVSDPALNWDKCLSLANGEYFCLLCDDDVYKPTFVEEMLKLAEAFPECNVFRARCGTIDKNGAITNLYPSSPLWESSEDYMYHVFQGLRHQTISEWMYRTEHIRSLGGFVHFPFAWHADYFSIFNLSKIGGIASTYLQLVFFRMSGENISSHLEKYGLEKAEANFMAYRTAKKYIEDADGVLKPLLELSLEVWKTGADKRLISALSFNDKLNVIRHRKQLGIPMRTVVISIVASIYSNFL